MSGSFTARHSDRMLDLLAERFKTLSDPARLKILQSLGSGESSVGELAEETGLPQSTVSRHLQALLRADLVARRKSGLYAYYSVADHTVEWVCDVVCGSLAQRLARDLSTMEGLPAEESAQTSASRGEDSPPGTDPPKGDSSGDRPCGPGISTAPRSRHV